MSVAVPMQGSEVVLQDRLQGEAATAPGRLKTELAELEEPDPVHEQSIELDLTLNPGEAFFGEEPPTYIIQGGRPTSSLNLSSPPRNSPK